MMDVEQFAAAARAGYVVFPSPDKALGEAWVAINLQTGYSGIDVDAVGALQALQDAERDSPAS